MLKPADIPAKDASGRRLIKTTVRGWRDIDDEFEGDLTDQNVQPVDSDTEITVRVSDDGFAFDWCYRQDPANTVWQADPV